MTSIPMQLVTGFLGSGKTTFLKNYLEEFSGNRKIGMIQNEFSEVNVDSHELRQGNADFQILEVNNGSVFCVCLLGSFIGSLAAFIDQYQPDELILEASGMSDPLSIGQILQSPLLKNKVYLDHVWCLVDALNFEKISSLQTQVNHQIRIADTIIINKTDLAINKNDAVIHRIKYLNPFATVITTTFARIDFTGRKSVMKVFPSGEKAENSRPDLQSVVIKSNRTISPEKLDEFLKLVHSGCIRSKGYINLTSGAKVFLQGSFDRFTLQEVETFAAPTEFIVIGNFSHGQNHQKLFENLCTS
ncbi:MAG: GTP-binding protein [Bacteroidota bacterium]|nr:GTP-binding protein [Bacteroidota bacterium]